MVANEIKITQPIRNNESNYLMKPNKTTLFQMKHSLVFKNWLKNHLQLLWFYIKKRFFD